MLEIGSKYKKLDYDEKSSDSYAINCQHVVGLIQIVGSSNAESEMLLNFWD